MKAPSRSNNMSFVIERQGSRQSLSMTEWHKLILSYLDVCEDWYRFKTRLSLLLRKYFDWFSFKCVVYRLKLHDVYKKYYNTHMYFTPLLRKAAIK